jgi:hypothetical protein
MHPSYCAITAKSRIVVRARRRATRGGSLGVRTIYRIIRAALGRNDIDAMDVDTAPQIMKRRGRINPIHQRASIVVVFIYFAGPIAISEKDQIPARSVRAMIDNFRRRADEAIRCAYWANLSWLILNFASTPVCRCWRNPSADIGCPITTTASASGRSGSSTSKRPVTSFSGVRESWFLSP